MRLAARTFVTMTLAVVMVLPTAGAAHAACHAFTVEADPSTASEGETVTLTIRRDAAVQPSSVRVRTRDVTADGGEDYTELDERVEFTDETEQTREVDILDDDAREDSETFDIELSDAEGCEVNQNYRYDSATVTIEGDAAAADESPAGEEPAAAQESPAAEQSPAAKETADGLPDTGSSGLVGVGLLVLMAAGGMLWRTRSARS